jgi:hypothetical protein
MPGARGQEGFGEKFSIARARQILILEDISFEVKFFE